MGLGECNIPWAAAKVACKPEAATMAKRAAFIVRSEEKGRICSDIPVAYIAVVSHLLVVLHAMAWHVQEGANKHTETIRAQPPLLGL